MPDKASKDTRAPAPVNLRRLYICLLILILTIGVISLAVLLKTSRSFDTMAKTYDPALTWIEDLHSTLTQARTSYQRSINPPYNRTWPSGDLNRLIEGMEKQDLPFEDSFFQDVKVSVRRMAGLFRLTQDMVQRRQWEEIQITVRDFDSTSGELLTILGTKKAEIRLAIDLEEMQIRKRLRLASFILSISLLLAVIITCGIYLNWRRLERTVLGIDS
jgi:hypothetical protein